MAAESSEISDYDRLRVESERMIDHLKVVYQSMGVVPPPSGLSSRNEMALIGPHMGLCEWTGMNKALNLCFAREKPLHGHSRTEIDLNGWPTTAKSQKVTGYWPLPDDDFTKWRNDMAVRYERLWKEIGIYDSIMLSTQQCKGDKNLFLAALCFWNTSSNTFDFPKGHMSISLLDILVISGFPIHYKPYIAGLYHDSNSEEELYPNRKIASATCKSYDGWIRFWIGRGDHEEHLAFLEMWLNKFIFCVNANKVTNHWKDMAIALHKGEKMSLGHQVLASLYRGLHQMVLSPLKFQSEGPFWILHYWLLVYFPDFGSNVSFTPDKVMGESLVNLELPSRSVWEYFRAFRSSDYRPTWGKVVTRKYPHPLRDMGFFPDRSSKWSNVDYYNMFRAAVCCKDLHYGGKLKQDKHLQMEVYAPNYFARQLGFYQAIPAPLINSVNHFTSWRRNLKLLAKVEGISELGDTDPDFGYVYNTAKVHSISGYDAWLDDVNKGLFSSDHFDRFLLLFAKLSGLGALKADYMLSSMWTAKELTDRASACQTASSKGSADALAALTSGIQEQQNFIREQHEIRRQEKLAEAKARLAASKAATSQAPRRQSSRRQTTPGPAQKALQSSHVAGESAVGRKRATEALDSSSQQKRRTIQSICRPSHESDDERTPTDEDMEEKVVADARIRREGGARKIQTVRARDEPQVPSLAQDVHVNLGNVLTAQRSRRNPQPSSQGIQQVVQANPSQSRKTGIPLAVPTGFGESSTSFVEDQVQGSESLSLALLDIIEADATTPTISESSPHELSAIVDLSTPSASPSDEAEAEVEVQPIEASNARPMGMDFAADGVDIRGLAASAKTHSKPCEEIVAIPGLGINASDSLVDPLENVGIQTEDMNIGEVEAAKDQQPSISIDAGDSNMESYGLTTSATFVDQVTLFPPSSSVQPAPLSIGLSIASKAIDSSSQTTSYLRKWAKEHSVMKDLSDELTNEERDAIRLLRNVEGEFMSEEQEQRAREAVSLLSKNEDSSIYQILAPVRRSLNLLPSIRDIFECQQEEFDELNEQSTILLMDRQNLATNALQVGDREDLINEKKKRKAEIQVQIASLQNELECLDKEIPVDEASLIDDLGYACSSLQDCDESIKNHQKQYLAKRHEVLDAKLNLEFQCRALIQFLQDLPNV